MMLSSYPSYYSKKITIHSSEIEDFIDTHLCKLCATLRSRVLPGVILIKDIGRRLPLLALITSLYQGQQDAVNQPVHWNP